MFGKIKKFLMSCGAVAVFLASPSGSSAVVINETLPFSFVFFGSCANESINVEGFFHRVVSQVEQPEGTIKARENLTAHGFGEGLTSGVEYRWNDKINTSEVQSSDPSFDVVTKRLLRLIGLGKAANQKIDLLSEFHVDSSGNVTIVSIVEVSCQGG